MQFMFSIARPAVLELPVAFKPAVGSGFRLQHRTRKIKSAARVETFIYKGVEREARIRRPPFGPSKRWLRLSPPAEIRTSVASRNLPAPAEAHKDVKEGSYDPIPAS